MSVTLGDIKAAAARILGKVHRTEVRTCDTFNKITEREIFFKCEIWQKTGSFKARGIVTTRSHKGSVTTCNVVTCTAGALNSLLSWREAHPEAGAPMVVTHSSGNHGQAVAWAARQTGSPCTVVVPEGTPRVKVRPSQIEHRMSKLNCWLYHGQGHFGKFCLWLWCCLIQIRT